MWTFILIQKFTIFVLTCTNDSLINHMLQSCEDFVSKILLHYTEGLILQLLSRRFTLNSTSQKKKEERRRGSKIIRMRGRARGRKTMKGRRRVRRKITQKNLVRKIPGIPALLSFMFHSSCAPRIKSSCLIWYIAGPQQAACY